MTAKPRKLTRKDVTFTLYCLPEDMPVRGNYLASGDPAYDKQVEDKILSDLEYNPWAWCLVRVTAGLEGSALRGVAYLGGCSYESEQQFREDNYFDDLCDEALRDLQQQVEHLFAKVGLEPEQVQA